MAERTISHRELRAHLEQVLAEVEQGATVKIAVAGRSVAKIVPIRQRPGYATREELYAFARTRRPDPTFRRDIRAILDQTVDEL